MLDYLIGQLRSYSYPQKKVKASKTSRSSASLRNEQSVLFTLLVDIPMISLDHTSTKENLIASNKDLDLMLHAALVLFFRRTDTNSTDVMIGKRFILNLLYSVVSSLLPNSLEGNDRKLALFENTTPFMRISKRNRPHAASFRNHSPRNKSSLDAHLEQLRAHAEHVQNMLQQHQQTPASEPNSNQDENKQIQLETEEESNQRSEKRSLQDKLNEIYRLLSVEGDKIHPSSLKSASVEEDNGKASALRKRSTTERVVKLSNQSGSAEMQFQIDNKMMEELHSSHDTLYSHFQSLEYIVPCLTNLR